MTAEEMVAGGSSVRDVLAIKGDLPIESPQDQGDLPIESPQDQSDLPIESPQDQGDSDVASMDPSDILKALEVVERDSVAIAENFASLFSSIRLSLSEASSSSVEHMQCFNDVVGRLQESVLDASTKGNRYINSCLRLNEELKGMESLAMQIKFLRRNVDALDLAVNRAVRF